MNLNNLKKAVLTAFVLMVMAFGGNLQANPAAPEFALAGLEALMIATEQSIRYIAPSALERDEVTDELERLEALVATTEASVKYEAPEAVEVAAELERLEMVAAITKASLKYEAPAADSFNTVENQYETMMISTH